MGLHLVCYEPEIPQNTGNMMRTCVATNTTLHLIEPLGFKLDDKYLKRSSMDYIKNLSWSVYPGWEDFVSRNPGTYYFLTRYGSKAHSSFDYSNPEEEIYFVVGKESTGIDKHILKGHLDHCMRLPMVEDARSLNVSNCAAIILYEALRQQSYPGLSCKEMLKGDHVLEDFE